MCTPCPPLKTISGMFAHITHSWKLFQACLKTFCTLASCFRPIHTYCPPWKSFAGMFVHSTLLEKSFRPVWTQFPPRKISFRHVRAHCPPLQTVSGMFPHIAHPWKLFQACLHILSTLKKCIVCTLWTPVNCFSHICTHCPPLKGVSCLFLHIFRNCFMHVSTNYLPLKTVSGTFTHTTPLLNPFHPCLQTLSTLEDCFTNICTYLCPP